MNSRMVRTMAIVHLPRTSRLKSGDSSISCVDLAIPSPPLQRGTEVLPDEDLVLKLVLLTADLSGSLEASISELHVGIVAVREKAQPGGAALLVRVAVVVEVLAAILDEGLGLDRAQVVTGLGQDGVLLRDGGQEGAAVPLGVVELQREAVAVAHRLVPEEVAGIGGVLPLAVEAAADLHALDLAQRGAAIEQAGLGADHPQRQPPGVAEGVGLVLAAVALEDAEAVLEMVAGQVAAQLGTVVAADVRLDGGGLGEAERAVVEGHQLAGRGVVVVALREQDLAALELELVSEGVGDHEVLDVDRRVDVLGAVGVALAEVRVVGVEVHRQLVAVLEEPEQPQAAEVDVLLRVLAVRGVDVLALQLAQDAELERATAVGGAELQLGGRGMGREGDGRGGDGESGPTKALREAPHAQLLSRAMPARQAERMPRSVASLGETYTRSGGRDRRDRSRSSRPGRRGDPGGTGRRPSRRSSPGCGRGRRAGPRPSRDRRRPPSRRGRPAARDRAAR